MRCLNSSRMRNASPAGLSHEVNNEHPDTYSVTAGNLLSRASLKSLTINQRSSLIPAHQASPKRLDHHKPIYNEAGIPIRHASLKAYDPYPPDNYNKTVRYRYASLKGLNTITPDAIGGQYANGTLTQP